jgi:hypothetical protein
MEKSVWVPGRLNLSRSAPTVLGDELVRCLCLGELSVVFHLHIMWCLSVDPLRVWVFFDVLWILSIASGNGVAYACAPCAWSHGPLVLISFKISGICVVDIRECLKS